MKRVSDADILKGRQLFRPKWPEMNEPCVSCPFRDDNDKSFGEITHSLAKKYLFKNRGNVKLARAQVKEEVTKRGDFVCHFTVYDVKTMQEKSPSEYKQCAGATQWFKTHIPGE